MNAAELARELSPAARLFPQMLERLTPEEVVQRCRELPLRDRLLLVAYERRAALEALASGFEGAAQSTARGARLELLAQVCASDGEEATLLLELAMDLRSGGAFLEARRRAYAMEAG